MTAATPPVTAPATTVVGGILFTDLVGFTDFNDESGDAAALEVLERQRSIVDAGISADARVVKELGDGLMVYFESAATAVTVACDLMEAIDLARARDEFPLAVRMGLHHGEALVRGDDLVGSTVNIAARVCDLAGPGELLVSDDAIGASRGGLSASVVACFHPIGPAQVRGVARPVWLHRLA